ncbi:MAG TPA: tautomerase family protein [Bacillota bacterium]|jgi:4-oxalocrotonate tautomerase family enzyme
MPAVIVEFWEGRTVEQKRRLVKAITKAMVDEAGSDPTHLHVIIHDVAKDSWGRNGKLGVDLMAEPKEAAAPAAPVPAAPAPAINRVSHLLLFVQDLDRALDFYVGLLGLQIRERTVRPDGRASASTIQGLGLTTFPAGEVKGKTVEHIAFRCPEGVEPIVEKLKAAGVAFDGPKRSPYGMSVYFRDPDGNRLECHDSTGV